MSSTHAPHKKTKGPTVFKYDYFIRSDDEVVIMGVCSFDLPERVCGKRYRRITDDKMRDPTRSLVINNSGHLTIWGDIASCEASFTMGIPEFCKVVIANIKVYLLG
jgi:hypothetical protein